eukprot:751727-Hanusia_phi.AAC.6
MFRIPVHALMEEAFSGLDKIKDEEDCHHGQDRNAGNILVQVDSLLRKSVLLAAWEKLSIIASASGREQDEHGRITEREALRLQYNLLLSPHLPLHLLSSPLLSSPLLSSPTLSSPTLSSPLLPSPLLPSPLLPSPLLPSPLLSYPLPSYPLLFYPLLSYPTLQFPPTPLIVDMRAGGGLTVRA